MKQILYTLIIILISFANARGQAKVTLYYNNSNEITTLEKSDFKRETVLDLNEMRFDGDFKDYDKQGRLVAEGAYKDGEKAGVFRTYNNSGALESAIEYPNREFVIQELVSPKGEKLVTNGTGKFSIPFTYLEGHFEIRNWKKGIITGEFYNGKRVGKWEYKTLDKNIKYQEVYEDGIFISRTGSYNSRTSNFGNRLKVTLALNYLEVEKFNYDHSTLDNLYHFFTQYPLQGADEIERDIIYPGGLSKLFSVIGENIVYPAEDQRNRTQGQVIISLTLDEYGKVKDKKIIKSLSPTLDSEALKVIKLIEGKLCPALLKGKAYETTLSIPLTFKLG